MQPEDRMMLRILAPFWRMACFSIFLGAVAIACGIGLISTSAYLISAAALHPSIAALEVSIVGVRFFGISRGVFVYLERLYSHSTNFKLVGGLRAWFYRKLEPLAPARLLDYRSGDLLARAVSDIEALEAYYVRVVAPPFVAVFILIGMQVFLGQFHPIFSGILTFSYFLGGILLPWSFVFLTRASAQAAVSARGRLHADSVDILQGSADLIAYGKTASALERLDIDGRLYEKALLNQSTYSGLSAAVLTLFSGLTAAGMLAFGTILVHQGLLDGVFLAVVALGSAASFEAVNPLPTSAQTLVNVRQSAGRLLEMVGLEPQVRDIENPLKAPLEWDLAIHHLKFHYPGVNTPAVDQFDLDLTVGKHVALVGPSGAGKTTLANLILRFWEITEGQILVNGEDVRHYRANDIRRNIGYISANVYVFNDSLRNNLRVACPEATDEQMLEACRKAQLSVWLKNRIGELDTQLGERGLQISGGERLRLAAARVLLQNPAIVILDEPTANLDAVTEREIVMMYLGTFADRTTLWISHRLIAMGRMDEILVIDRGKIVERGSETDLIHLDGLYARLKRIQSQMIEESGETH